MRAELDLSVHWPEDDERSSNDSDKPSLSWPEEIPSPAPPPPNPISQLIKRYAWPLFWFVLVGVAYGLTQFLGRDIIPTIFGWR
jgi:hypothetical protein